MSVRDPLEPDQFRPEVTNEPKLALDYHPEI